MIRLTLTTPPRLHTISLEPGEVGTLELDAAALLATGEDLDGYTIDDAGSGTMGTPTLSGALCTLQITAPATNSIILGEIFLSGDAGTIIRTSLRLRSIDPLNSAAPAVTRIETLKWLGDYSGTGVYTLNNIVRSGGSLWRAKRSVTGVAPVDGDDWDIFTLEGSDLVMSGTLANRPAASVSYRGQFYTVEGVDGSQDITQICRKTAADTYEWRELTLNP